MGDKDIAGSFDQLKTSGVLENSEVFAVKVKDNPRGADAEKICSIASDLGIKATPFESLEVAYKEALKNKKLTVICGSLYLYKDFAEII